MITCPFSKTLFTITCLIAPFALGKVYYEETFSSDDWDTRWIQSTTKDDYGKFEVNCGKRDCNDTLTWRGLQTTQDARFYAISSKLSEPLDNEGKTLVVQYTVSHEQKIDCGGAYLKLGSFGDNNEFNSSMPYSLMFGPDICGSSHRTHMIITYNNTNVEKTRDSLCEKDTKPHVYTLSIYPNNTYRLAIDTIVKEQARIEESWAVLEPPEIDDPDDKKPSDWIDDPQMDDPTDIKPEGYDDIKEKLPDPDANQPDDWDAESDGLWEPPMIPNTDYKGIWKPKKINHPAFKGVWKPRKLPNPFYKPDDKLYVLPKMTDIGIEIWQVKSGTLFDDILLTDDEEYALKKADETLALISEREERVDDEMKESDPTEVNRPSSSIDIDL